MDTTEEVAELVDFTDSFPGCIAAQAKSDVCVILYRIDPIEASRRRLDRKRASYECEVRYLSRQARPGTDDYVCVQGSVVEYLQAKEFPRLHRAVRTAKPVNLFDHLLIQ